MTPLTLPGPRTTIDQANEKGKVIYHVVQTDVFLDHSNNDEKDEVPLRPFSSKIYYRIPECVTLIEHTKTVCDVCLAHNRNIQYILTSKQNKIDEPAKRYAPITKTNPVRVKLALQNERLKCAQLENELEQMRKELRETTVRVDNTLHNDCLDILSDSNTKITPFMNLFWQQQKRLFQRNPKGMRYHPMIIKFCLSIASKSKSAYEELRNSNILKLPSTRTLIDYKNYIRPKAGFRRQVLDNLNEITKDFFDVERYVVLLFDEMKIRSNLVFNKHTEELIGFVDLGDPELNFNSFDKQSKLATHTLVFYLRGICTNLKYSLAHFATDGVTASQLYAIFWEAVSLLEITCNLWVIAATSDGAGANRRFYKLLAGESNDQVPYKTVNLVAPWRYIYLLSDPPHLVKTARNCLANSGGGTFSRFMWNENKTLLWQHIIQMYSSEDGCKLLPRLTLDHINLTSYSRMTVSYAAQVLSDTVSTVLTKYGSPEFLETAKYCKMNVRSLNEGRRKNKPFLVPYSSCDDERFDWLENNLLPYFDNWKCNIETRNGNFSKTAQAKMFISKQTHEGIQITVNAMIECIKFLLKEGMEYILTERFCQDPVEEYFGNQRMLGRRSDNPDFNQCLYNDNTIRIQKEVSITTGNTRGRYDKKRNWENISVEPIKKRKSNDTSKVSENLKKIKFNIDIYIKRNPSKYYEVKGTCSQKWMFLTFLNFYLI